MKFNRTDITSEPEAPAGDTMQDFIAQERAAALAGVKKSRALNEKQLRGLAGDAEVDRMKRYGQLT